MKISTIICTRNRAAHLPYAIRSLAEQDLASGDYETIVVDNGSSDGTKEVVSGLMTEISNLRYVHEQSPGLSNARNRGINQATASVVAFLDDDAIAVRTWLSAILDAFNTNPQPVGVGGPVEPWWENPPPAWFPVSLLGCHNRYYGPEARWCNYPAEQPVGCNMAFLKEAVKRVGGFNANLKKYNDETELIARLVKAGGGIYYQPGAIVQHLVPKERLHLSWQIKRHFEEGKSLADVAALQPDRPRIGRIAEVRDNLLSIAKRSARLFISRDPVHQRVQRLADLSTLVGKTIYLTKGLRED